MIMGEFKVILIFLCLFCLAGNNLIAGIEENIFEPRRYPIIGFIGANPEDFALLKEWGASTIVYMNPETQGNDIDSIIECASGYNLGIILRAPHKSSFQTSDCRIDFVKVGEMLENYFAGSNILDQPSFIGFYLIDEPINYGREKWNISAEDLDRLYGVVKDFNSNIQVFINFGDPRHINTYLDSAKKGLKLADITMFTVTTKKISQQADYISYANEIAKKAKRFDSNMKIIPALAMIEFVIEKGGITYITPMPSANWLMDVSQEILDCNGFDGILFYSFSSKSPWMGGTISDIKTNKKYINAFKYILKMAGKKFR